MKAIEATLRANLLAVARAYARGHRLRMATVAQKVHGDSRFFDRLRDRDGSFTVRKFDEVMAAIIADWPAGAEWPSLAHVVFTKPDLTTKENPAWLKKPASQKPVRKRPQRKPRQ